MNLLCILLFWASLKWLHLLKLWSIADVAQLKRHQRWSVSSKCACAVTAPVVTAHAHLQFTLHRWWRLSCATSAIVVEFSAGYRFKSLKWSIQWHLKLDFSDSYCIKLYCQIYQIYEVIDKCKYNVLFFSRAVKFSAKLMGKAMAKRMKATILYATETGKSETYAKKLSSIFNHAFDAKVRHTSFGI